MLFTAAPVAVASRRRRRRRRRRNFVRTRKSAMQRCSYASYRDGSWQSNATATAPYRLTRDLQTNAFVKGWAYGKGRF